VSLHLKRQAFAEVSPGCDEIYGWRDRLLHHMHVASECSNYRSNIPFSAALIPRDIDGNVHGRCKMSRKNIIGGLVLAAGFLPALAQAATAYLQDTTEMHAGPDYDYPTIDVVPAGDGVVVHGCLSDWSWCDVGYAGLRGWIAADELLDDYDRRPIALVGPSIGLGVLSFSFSNYWDSHYRSRDFYRDRDRWRNHARAHYRDHSRDRERRHDYDRDRYRNDRQNSYRQERYRDSGVAQRARQSENDRAEQARQRQSKADMVRQQQEQVRQQRAQQDQVRQQRTQQDRARQQQARQQQQIQQRQMQQQQVQQRRAERNARLERVRESNNQRVEQQRQQQQQKREQRRGKPGPGGGDRD
jgi:uncharacterized protein YraI